MTSSLTLAYPAITVRRSLAVRRMPIILTEVYSLQAGIDCPIPLFLEPVEAGFPSPADDYVDCTIDLNEHLIKNPPRDLHGESPWKLDGRCRHPIR